MDGETSSPPGEEPRSNTQHVTSSDLYASLDEIHTPKASQKTSGPSAYKPQLSPSPRFRESATRPSLDVPSNGTLSRYLTRVPPGNLFLQMPSREHEGTTAVIEPFSPQSEQQDNFGSPNTVLPRRSRGMDFARACTNLHHSTVPNKATPDSSPVFAHKSMKIPSRRSSTVSAMWETPRPIALYSSSTGGSNDGFRPRSLGSTTGMMSDASDSSSDDDDIHNRAEDGDEIIMTPQVKKQQGENMFTPYGLRETNASASTSHLSSPIDRRYHPFRRSIAGRGAGRLQGIRRLGTQNSMEESPSTEDRGDEESVESPLRKDNYMRGNALRITTSTDSGDEGTQSMPSSTPGVVRRPVVRRSNLLPKTKGFARIRAALQEESVPIDTDFKREAEVVRQVRAKEPGPLSRGLSTASSSPDLTPSTSSMPHDASDISDVDGLGVAAQPQDPPGLIPPDDRRVSMNRELWPHLYNRLETPPPPLFRRPRSSSGVSEDMHLDSPATQTPVSNGPLSANGASSGHKPGSDTDASPFQAPNMPSAADISRKINKRRRDEDFDPTSIKRRAVSPGMSVASSPIRGQSPVSNVGGWWGQPKPLRQDSGGSIAEDRSASMSSTGLTTPAIGPMTPSLGPKRFGTAAQTNMLDTNDGLTKMTLE